MAAITAVSKQLVHIPLSGFRPCYCYLPHSSLSSRIWRADGRMGSFAVPFIEPVQKIRISVV